MSWLALTSRARHDRGAAAVEFALVVPLLVILLLGTITSGVTYSHSVGLTNAVREGSRFGATADASSSMASAWAASVIQRVRDTQFDDPSIDTRVCVQLWKIGTGPVANTSQCSTGGDPTLVVPTTATEDPAVPASPVGSCVVRVIAARPFTINVGVTKWDNVDMSSTVARYERIDKVPSCA